MNFLRLVFVFLLCVLAAPFAAYAQPQGISAPADVIGYLNSIKTKGVISGIYTSIHGQSEVQSIVNLTGKTPGIIGGDYYYDGQVQSIPPYIDPTTSLFVSEWRAGSLVMLTTHWPNPTTGGSDRDTSNVDPVGMVTPGNASNTSFNSILDQIAAGIQTMQNNGVVVIWRPFHEMAGSWFWWGVGNGHWTNAQFIAVWRYTHDYMVNTKGLHNIVWAFTGVNAGAGPVPIYPGDAYVDIVGLDCYTSNPADYLSDTLTIGSEFPNKALIWSEFGPGNASSGDPNFALPTLVNAFKNTMPNVVAWQSWDSVWSIDQMQQAAAGMADPYVINQGSIVYTGATQPAMIAPSAITVIQGITTPIAGVSATDTTNPGDTMAFTATSTGSGRLSATGATGNGTTTISFSGSLTALNSLLTTVTFSDTSIENTTITWQVTDAHARTATATTAVTVTQTSPVSPNCTIITPGNGSINDGHGNVYTLTSGQVATLNGVAMPDGAGTSQMEWYNSTVYAQDAASGTWYTWNGTNFQLASGPPGSSCQATTTPVAVYANLAAPWGIAALPNGDLLVTQRDAFNILRISTAGSLVATIVVPNTVTTNDSGGLMGIAIDPQFSSNGFIYLCHTKTFNGGYTAGGNEVIRYTLAANNTISGGLSLFSYDANAGQNGGSIGFGPDGYLYVGEGDAGNPGTVAPYLAQTRGNETNGKILRIVPSTGAAAPSNLYNTDGTVHANGDGKTIARTYAFGFRDVLGFTWDSSGNLWANDHGPHGEAFGPWSGLYGYDKINQIISGGNYGFPLVYGPNTTTDAYGNTTLAPSLQSGSGVFWGPAGMAFFTNSNFIGALGSATASATGVQALDQTVVSGTNLSTMVNNFAGTYGRIRGVVQNPNDGNLYFATSNTDGATRLDINQPGGTGSAWNTPLGTGATWGAATDPDTIDISRCWNGSTYVAGPCGGNINTTSFYGFTFWVGRATDPLYTVTYTNGRTQPPDNGATATESIHIPNGFYSPGPYPGDNNVGVIDSVSSRIYNFSASIQTPLSGGGTIAAGAGEWDDPMSNVMGHDYDTGLAGYIVALGTINYCDVNPACNRSYPKIRHALRYSTDTHLVKSNATTPGGSILLPTSWPQRLQDTQTASVTYTGNLLAGTTLGIPLTTAMPGGLDANCQGLFWTMQHYPLFFRDTAGGGFNLTVDQVADTSAYTTSARACLVQLVYLLRPMRNQHIGGQSFTTSPINGPGARSDTGPPILGLYNSGDDHLYKVNPQSLVNVSPPVWTAPTSVTARLSIATTIPNLTVASSVSGTFNFTGTVNGGSGVLTATGATGSGTGNISFSGTLAALNTMLATMKFTDSVVENGSISWSVTDPNSVTANANTAFSVTNVAKIGCPWCRP